MNGDILANRMTYETEQGLTIRGADGTAVSVFTGQGATVDAGASGLSAVIDAGSNNTFIADGPTAVAMGGDNSTLMAGRDCRLTTPVSAHETRHPTDDASEPTYETDAFSP